MRQSARTGLSQSGHLDVLAAIPREHRASILARCQQRSYRKGEIIWSQGDAAPLIGFLVEGKAVSEYHSASGRMIITGLWFPGDLIGANNLDTYNLHQMTMRCLENSVVYTLPVEQFYEFVRAYPELAEAIIKALSVRLHWFGNLAVIFGTHTAWERICGMLLALSEHFSVPAEKGTLIDLKLTHETLAGMVGVTRSFLTVTLRQLERRGAIGTVRRRIVIRDRKQLEELAFGREAAKPSRQGARTKRATAD